MQKLINSIRMKLRQHYVYGNMNEITSTLCIWKYEKLIEK